MSKERPPQGDQLGNCLQVFKPMMGNIIAGFIFSIILLIGGVAAIGISIRGVYVAGWDLPLDVKKGWSWFAVGLMCLAGVCLAVSGIVLMRYSRGLISHRIEVCTNGFRYCTGPFTEDVLWSDVLLVEETFLHERPPIRILPKWTSARYTVITVGGREFSFDENSVKSIKRFGKILRAHADFPSQLWKSFEQDA